MQASKGNPEDMRAILMLLMDTALNGVIRPSEMSLQCLTGRNTSSGKGWLGWKIEDVWMTWPWNWKIFRCQFCHGPCWLMFSNYFNNLCFSTWKTVVDLWFKSYDIGWHWIWGSCIFSSSNQMLWTVCLWNWMMRKWCQGLTWRSWKMLLCWRQALPLSLLGLNNFMVTFWPTGFAIVMHYLFHFIL